MEASEKRKPAEPRSSTRMLESYEYEKGTYQAEAIAKIVEQVKKKQEREAAEKLELSSGEGLYDEDMNNEQLDILRN